MSFTRDFHSATLLPDGRVMVAGGRGTGSGGGGGTDAVEIFDPATRTWAFGPSMLDRRELHAGIVLASGDVLIVGGEVSGSGTDAASSLFDPEGR